MFLFNITRQTLEIGYFSGAVLRVLEDFTTAKHIPYPPACSAIQRTPSTDNYGNRQYMVGGHTANLIIDEEFRCSRQGIMPPTAPPTVSVGAGPPAFDQICYLTYYDEVTDERSSLSAGKSLTGDLVRVWTVLPTTVPNEQIVVEGTVTFAAGVVTGVKTKFGELRPGDRIAVSTALTRWSTILTIASQTSMTIDDTGMAGAGVVLVAKPVSRVSHIELWVSVAGALPRFITRVRIGTTAITESTATLALGEAFINTFEPMPFGAINCFYGDRQIVAGVEGHRDTVFLSAIGFPERYEGLSFVTAYNEPIVGMFKFRDYVVLLCPDSSYKLQGYTEDDYNRTVLEPDIGGLGHHGNKIAEGRAFVPGRKGLLIFNGAFHQGIPTRRNEWSQAYIDNVPAFERGFGAVNPNDETYHFFRYPLLSTGLNSTDGLNSYVGDYGAVGPQAGGDLTPLEWVDDTNTNPIVFAGYLVPSGTKVGKFYRGDRDGKIYVEDDTGVYPFSGTSIIVPAHILFGDAGGGPREGKRIIRLWSYVVSEDTAWEMAVWPGDEYAYPPDKYSGLTNSVVAGYIDAVAASFSTANVTDYKGLGAKTLVYVKKSVHHHIVEGQPVAGRGFSFEYRFIEPLNVRFLGLGGVWEPGDTSRPVYAAYVPI